MNKKEIASTITALANEKKEAMSEVDVLMSPQMHKYLSTLADTMLFGRAQSPSIIVIADDPQITASTNGYRITLNALSGMCQDFTTPETRFAAFMGMLYHELSHILYNDFDAFNGAIDNLKNGVLPGEMPVASNDEEQTALDDMLTALKDANFAPIFCKVFNELDNTVADRHDEDKLIEEYGGTARESISLMREHLFAEALPVEFAHQAIEAERLTKLEAMDWLLLDYVRFGRIACNVPELEKTSELVKTLISIADHAENAYRTDDPNRKFTELNYIMLALWPYIREELDRMQEAASQNGGQDQDGPTKEMIEQILSQLANAMAQASSQTTAPMDMQTSELAAENTSQAQMVGSEGQQTKMSVAPTDQQTKQAMDALMAQLQGIIDEIAKEAAIAELENKATQDMHDMAVSVLNQTSLHKGVPVLLTRVGGVEQQDIDKYNSVMKDMSSYIKRLQKRLLELIKETELQDVRYHRSFGRQIVAQDYYRPDGLFFATKKNPTEDISLAISILVDESGSMNGKKIIESRNAAMLLHSFATGLGLPTAVAGHTTSDEKVCYTVYTDFDEYNPNEKYRLAKMKAQGENRDGAAIEIMASRLLARPEKMKLMIVISDGLPSHLLGKRKYGGIPAEQDITSIVAKYRKKGVEIIGAAIDLDKDTIARIYGDGYLEISDLNRMSKTFINIVKSKLLSQIL